MGKRLGRKLGSRIGTGGGSKSTGLPDINLGSPGGIDLDLMGIKVDLDLVQSDIGFIQANTPVVSGDLKRSYGISNGNITSSSPYVNSVENRHHMVERAENSIARALVDRAIRQFNSQDIPDFEITIKV